MTQVELDLLGKEAGVLTRRQDLDRQVRSAGQGTEDAFTTAVQALVRNKCNVRYEGPFLAVNPKDTAKLGPYPAEPFPSQEFINEVEEEALDKRVRNGSHRLLHHLPAAELTGRLRFGQLEEFVERHPHSRRHANGS
jgi:hypothetical protein